ncbi:hypothetical protein M408DRAFT_23140 [Serendipita vermifera MAFF 305830]|uniref:C2H2-type domain-containing protein n=1 Tax=Serendipita vermifera MAFF 305830 TaxID=933852 RepID=A0A0C3AWK5_SERVB|nr:hypothetical protein M408DRAFT_23140 [Serendipita vermifera MAFF 305830]
MDELECHYTQCHAYVCNAEGCTAVFEREFYLNLHQEELHDPLAQIKKERGESIYRCLIPECSQMMQTPNQRKRHLIKDHQFDEGFFFAVIRFGIGDQLRAWGSANDQVQTSPGNGHIEGDQEFSKINKEHTSTEVDGQSNQGSRRRTPRSSAQSSRASSSQPFGSGMENLTLNMKNTSLVPDSVQFGHDAKKAVPQHTSYKRNASFPDVKMHLSQYHAISRMSDDDGDDEGRDKSLEGDEPQLGVRFAEEVAIRFLSPIDRRYGHEKRGKKKMSGKANGRTRGVHSDDEGGTRSKNFKDSRSGNGSRGRYRGNRGRDTNERGFRGEGMGS